MKLIAKAIIEVMKSVRGMEKKSRVGTGRAAYDGTKDQDVKEAFNVALVKAGLSVLPIGMDEETRIDRWEADGYDGKKVTKQSVFTKVKTRYLLLHVSGESIELCGYGHGVDPQDKGAGKATTYALKNCLLYTFMTPVGKIPDTDTTHSELIDSPPIATPEKKEVKVKKAAKSGFALFLEKMSKAKAYHGNKIYYEFLLKLEGPNGETMAYTHANQITSSQMQDKALNGLRALAK